MTARTRFGSTWWGRAWVAALEDLAALDPSRLSRGRTYARHGNVGAIAIHPGYASAEVRGQHGRIYRTDVEVRSLGPSEWEQVADAIAAKAAHAAALLDGELDPGVVADAEAVDVRLLPGPGDLRPDCSCPDWAEPCKHAAALCYLLASELDRDPFALFTLRGMSRDDLLGLVRSRRSAAPDETPPGDSLGVDARSVWAAQPFDSPLRPLPPLVADALVHLPAAAVHPPAWDVELPPGLGFTRHAIDALAVDATERAFAALVDGVSLGLDLGIDADLARRAATLDPGDAAKLSMRLGFPPGHLAARVQAWQLGGAVGVSMLIDPTLWSTDQAALSAGRDALVDLGYRRRSVSLNYDSLRMRGAVFLAIGPDHRWYRFTEKGKRHTLHLTHPPADDVCDLVDPPPDAGTAGG